MRSAMWSRGDARARDRDAAGGRPRAAGPDRRLRSARVHAARERARRRRGRRARRRGAAPATRIGRCCGRSGRCCVTPAICRDRRRCSSRWSATTRRICSPPTRSARPTRRMGRGRRPRRSSSGCWPRRRMTRRRGTTSARCTSPRTVSPTRVDGARRGRSRSIPALAGAHNGLGVAYARSGDRPARGGASGGRRWSSGRTSPTRAYEPRAHASAIK